MNCQFIRDKKTVICKICGFSIITEIEPNKLNMICNGVSTKNKDYPSLLHMGKNLLSSAMNFVKDGFKITDEEEHNRRLEICKGNPEKGIPTCPSYDKSQNRCIECGCFVNWATAISSKHCPLGKW